MSNRPPPDPRLKGMEVRFEGRTLRVLLSFDHEPATRTRKTFDAFVTTIRAAAAGPGLRMTAVAGGMGPGSIVRLEIMVNTDETAAALEARIEAALQRAGVTLAVLASEQVDRVQASMYWAAMARDAGAQAERERGRS